MHVEHNIKLSLYTTMKVGGTASHFVQVSSTEELRESLQYAKKEQLPVSILGGGSNMLVQDGEIRALVIQNVIRGIEWNADISRSTRSISVGAGEPWDEFVKETVERGLWGLENLSGIPGTVGGAPVQNIGAYGTEVKETVESVGAIHHDTFEEKIFTNDECAFGYRDSFFKTAEGKRWVITSVRFGLSTVGIPKISYKDVAKFFGEKKEPTLLEIRNAILEIRKSKFPDLREVGTAGSFFKNPIVSVDVYNALKGKYPEMPGFETAGGVKIPLAWILENVLGKRGYRKGDVALFERQPIVIVNYGTATATDIEVFAREIEHEVFEKTGIRVEREVRTIRS